MAAPVKLFHRRGSRWVEHVHAPTFAIETASAGTERLVAGLPARSACGILASLAQLIEPPFLVLYVLHTPRGEGEPGRYQSPPLDGGSVRKLLKRFRAYLTADGRFDLWIHSASEDATLVWDRHNLLFGYGPVDRLAAALVERGFTSGRPSLDFDHLHHYRRRYDADAAALLEMFDWTYTPLRPADFQI